MLHIMDGKLSYIFILFHCFFVFFVLNQVIMFDVAALFFTLHLYMECKRPLTTKTGSSWQSYYIFNHAQMIQIFVLVYTLFIFLNKNLIIKEELKWNPKNGIGWKKQGYHYYTQDNRCEISLNFKVNFLLSGLFS